MEDWEALYREARSELAAARGRRTRDKPFRVGFYPYAGLRSLIHDRGDHFEVRLGDLLREAPRDAHTALAKLLIGKLDRRLRTTPDERAPYLTWARSREVREQDEAIRRRRGRKVFDPPRGAVHDLERLFERLNVDYFDGALARPRVGWSRTVSRRLYGHHDPAHDAIVINRLLDHPRVPEAVVADILHHEMLHVKHGVAYREDGRRVLHSRDFKRDERRYAYHAEAQQFLRALEARRIRLRPTNRGPALTPSQGPSQGSLDRWTQMLKWRPNS